MLFTQGVLSSSLCSSSNAAQVGYPCPLSIVCSLPFLRTSVVISTIIGIVSSRYRFVSFRFVFSLLFRSFFPSLSLILPFVSPRFPWITFLPIAFPSLFSLSLVFSSPSPFPYLFPFHLLITFNTFCISFLLVSLCWVYFSS